MNRNQAEEMLRQYGYITGKTVSKGFISSVSLCSLSHKEIIGIANDRLARVASVDRFRHVHEFDVVILYDLNREDWTTCPRFESLVTFLLAYPEFLPEP